MKRRPVPATESEMAPNRTGECPNPYDGQRILVGIGPLFTAMEPVIASENGNLGKGIPAARDAPQHPGFRPAKRPDAAARPSLRSACRLPASSFERFANDAVQFNCLTAGSAVGGGSRHLYVEGPDPDEFPCAGSDAVPISPSQPRIASLALPKVSRIFAFG